MTLQIGQALLFLLIATIGFILNRKSKQIHVLVNSRLDEALDRIRQLENSLGLAKGEPVPPPDPRIPEIVRSLLKEREDEPPE